MTDRLTLMQTLMSIPQEQLLMLIFTLKTPKGIIPPNNAPQGQQVFALLQWAESPSGCGLGKIQGVLETIINPPNDHQDINPSSTPVQPQPIILNTMEQQRNRDQVFISYSHKDKEWLEKLETHLKPLVRQGLSVWSDQEIKAGAKWKDEIDKALASARVAVLMVSPDFLASDFIDQHELPPLLDAAEKEGLKIIWIYISSCSYKLTEIQHYHAAHDISKPLKKLSEAELDDVLVEICEKIADVFQTSTEKKT